MNDLTHSESILIEASPEAVYDLVSDVARTGEWSPVCNECWWDEGATGAVGDVFTGRNVLPDRTWETRCRGTAAERGRIERAHTGISATLAAMKRIAESADRRVTPGSAGPVA